MHIDQRMADPSLVLDVRNLATHFDTRAGIVKAVDGVSFTLRRGEVLGIVGESGSGKSITGYSIMGVIDPPGRLVSGQVEYVDKLGKTTDLAGMSDKNLRKIRGNRLAMILQDPMMSLNPCLRIGTQLTETYLAHHPEVGSREANIRAIDVMRRVSIPDPEHRMRAYPHEFSGGMRQRVAIAMALINDPDVIIADEPTTALDVTTQAQILYEVQKLSGEFGTSWIWITHDLAVVAGLATNVAVMYGGRIVEQGPVDQLLDTPLHPYTHGLVASIPGKPQSDRRLYQIPGNAPSLLNPPRGCPFKPRCNRALEQCATMPSLLPISSQRQLRCFNPLPMEGHC